MVGQDTVGRMHNVRSTRAIARYGLVSDNTHLQKTQWVMENRMTGVKFASREMENLENEQCISCSAGVFIKPPEDLDEIPYRLICFILLLYNSVFNQVLLNQIRLVLVEKEYEYSG